MIQINFYKYQGTGNDFVIIDDRENVIDLNKDQVAHICNRKFGIGADGLILLRKEEGYDFRMVYYNSDGKESSMCGNGGRCIARFASDIDIISGDTHFIAIDGPHETIIRENKVSLQMSNVVSIECADENYVLNTGSPHYVIFNNDVMALDIIHSAQEIRYNETYKEVGINVNFVQEEKEGEILMRTYERGVEGETLSCGTGVTAAAIAYAEKNNWSDKVMVRTKGGNLNLSFDKEQGMFKNIWLSGPAKFVFKGSFRI